MASAGWYPDPLGRAQVRYFDGTEWSQWAADDGRSRLDADAVLAGLPDPPAAPPPGMPAPPGTGWSPTTTLQQYRSVQGLSTALTWVLVGSILSALGLAVTLANRLDLIQKLRDFEFVSRADINDANDAVSGAASLLGAFNLAVFVLLVIFLYRAVKNAELWNSEKERWTPGWAIGGWFIPLAWFVIPFLVVRETWRRSDSGASVHRQRARTSTLLLWAWWLLFVVGYLVIQVDPWKDTLEEAQIRDASGLGGALLLVASGVLMIIMIRRLARWQKRNAQASV